MWANWGIFFWGGGLNIFFRGRNVHQGFSDHALVRRNKKKEPPQGDLMEDLQGQPIHNHNRNFLPQKMASDVRSKRHFDDTADEESLRFLCVHCVDQGENQTCTTLWLPFRVAFAPPFRKRNLPFSGA